MSNPGPCLVCGGTDYKPQGFYRHAGWSYDGGTLDNPVRGPYHFHCADTVAATRKTVRQRMTTTQTKRLDGIGEAIASPTRIVTSKPNRRDKKR